MRNTAGTGAKRRLGSDGARRHAKNAYPRKPIMCCPTHQVIGTLTGYIMIAKLGARALSHMSTMTVRQNARIAHSRCGCLTSGTAAAIDGSERSPGRACRVG